MPRCVMLTKAEGCIRFSTVLEVEFLVPGLWSQIWNELLANRAILHLCNASKITCVRLGGDMETRVNFSMDAEEIVATPYRMMTR